MYNSIFGTSSYSERELRKKKIRTRVPCNNFFFFFKFDLVATFREPYSNVLNGTRAPLKFFFFFFKFDRPILNFLQIEFYIETQF